ncbi:hypothetical protein [Candidatus Hodgkinia cicadicola]|uniref:hypothetical protein n=1 Tax=Candidatus Hodgkinia cicadicola TaxID=573658 RepID=UPI0011BA8952
MIVLDDVGGGVLYVKMNRKTYRRTTWIPKWCNHDVYFMEITRLETTSQWCSVKFGNYGLDVLLYIDWSYIGN